MKSFLPRAFRRPVDETDIAPYMELFHAAQRQQQPFEASILLAFRGALVSPNFLFRFEPPNKTTEVRPLDQYALASRLSYFLWGSMPDEFLFDVAAAGKLNDPVVMKELVRRMLRNDRSMFFAQRFTEQWLHTRELSGDKAPDAKLFPAYAADEELRGDIRFQPIMFFRELMLRNMSVLESAGFEVHDRHKQSGETLRRRAAALKTNARKQPQWVELPPGSNRGGLLGMPAVLTVSSHPYRTSPVLRGAWILDSILGTPPPPPPPNVPALEETKDGVAAQVGAREADAASRESSVRELPRPHRSAGLCARKLRCDRHAGGIRKPESLWTTPAN